jgi:hypothetical protein|tara:strand:+ start:703 stop:969 length:267 start_codon:yes stop_codon:yes gene_type:complete
MTKKEEMVMNLGWAITYDANGEIVHACDESNHDYRDTFDYDYEYSLDMDDINEFNDMLVNLTDKFGAANVKMLNTKHGVHNVCNELPF